jgi:glucose-6-phosphate 1-dehydrogenase
MAALIQSEEQGRPGDPCVLTIFGASGDLTKRKLLPALYNLARKKLLPSNFALVGFALDNLSEDEFRKAITEDLRQFAGAPEHCEFCDWLAPRVYYVSGNFNNAEAYQKLKEVLATVDEKHETQGNSSPRSSNSWAVSDSPTSRMATGDA